MTIEDGVKSTRAKIPKTLNNAIRRLLSLSKAKFAQRWPKWAAE